MTDDEELAPGSIFAGRFEIVRPLGEGAFGAVFEARMQPMMRRCALKVLHADAVGNAKVAVRFVREARILGEFEHPHVVSVLDVGLHEGTPYIAMELLQGETLAARVRQGALPVSEALSVLLPVCSALVAVHERDIVHRDLKPENIMLARQATGQVVPKILDFGIAKADLRDGEATRSRAIMGTPFYMSPEQAVDSKNIDARSDQWALGVIAWELLAGRRPFTGPHQIAVLNAVISGVVPSLRAASPEVPGALEAVITRMLSRDPGWRYESVREAARAMLPFADLPTQAVWTKVFGTATSALPSIDPSTSQVTPPPAAPAMATFHAAPPPREVGALSISSHTVPPSSSTLPEAPAASRQRSGAIALTAGLLIVLAGVGIAWSQRSPATTTTAADLGVPTSFTVRVIADPGSASLRLDNAAPTQGSLQVSLPRDGRPHTLVVRANGYAPENLHFTDVSPPERVVLHRLPIAVAPPPPAPTPAGAPPPPPVAVARSQPTPVAAPSPVAPRPAGAGRRRTPNVDSSPLIHAPAPSGGSCPNGQCVF